MNPATTVVLSLVLISLLIVLLGYGKGHSLRPGGGVAPEGGHIVPPLEEADCEPGNQAQNVAFSPGEDSLCFWFWMLRVL